MRRFLLVIGAIIIGVIVWLSIGVSQVISAENDVKTRFRDIVDFYISMDQTYVTPLMTDETLQEGDKKALEDISEKMKELANTSNIDQQYEKLLLVQKAIISFVGSGSYPEKFSADSRFSDWSKNATNLGIASSKIRLYNEALSSYNARFKSTAGQLSTIWNRWNFHKYLGINGEQEEETIITF